MNDVKFKQMTFASFCMEEKDVLDHAKSCKWDGKSMEFLPHFPDGHGGAFDNLQHMAEYIETGGSYRFVQMALAGGKIIIQNKFGEYYGVEIGDDKDTISECVYIPMSVNSLLHCSHQMSTASELIGKSLKDITTLPDADMVV